MNPESQIPPESPQPQQPPQQPPQEGFAQQPSFTSQQPAQEPQQAPVGAQPQQQAPAPGENPGKTFGIVSLVTSLIGLGLVGLIFGILGLKKSKKVGQGNGLAIAGIIIGILNIIAAIIVATFIIVGISAVSDLCKNGRTTSDGSGTTTVQCGDDANTNSSFDSTTQGKI